MKCLRRVVGCTLWDRRRNEDISAEAKVAPITEKVKENRLRWFGHVCRKREDDLVKGKSKERTWTPSQEMDGLYEGRPAADGLDCGVALDRGGD